MFSLSRRLTALVAAIAVISLAAPASASADDLRNPDSRAAALDSQRESSMGGAAPGTTADSGFDWGDAGIGAGTVLGLLLIALSVAFARIHRRRSKAGGPPLTA